MTAAAANAVEFPDDRPARQAPALERVDARMVSRPSVEVAPSLLGMLLVRELDGVRRIARIVETEAYAGPEDRASHARAGRTARTAVMFGPPGYAYVYLVYGMHHCLNVVCGSDEDANAVLIRAIEPLVGVDLMRTRRGAAGGPDVRLGAGPARLCQALDIDRSLGGSDLLHGAQLWLAHDASPAEPPARIVSGPRIGVDHAGPEWASRRWRFGLADHPALSRPFPRHA